MTTVGLNNATERVSPACIEAVFTNGPTPGSWHVALGAGTSWYRDDEDELDAVGREARLSEPWYPDSYYIQPHYSTMPSYLRVEDVFAPTLGPRKRRFWTKARDQALAKWSPVGFRWETIDAITPYDRGPGDAGHRGCPTGDRRVGGVRVPAVSRGSPRLRLGPHRRRDVERRLVLEISGNLRSVLTHEFGHSLGFGHGGDGVMAVPRVSNTPNAEEIAAAKTYWGMS